MVEAETLAALEAMYGTEKEMLHNVTKEINGMAEANDLFNFYNKHKGEI